MKSESRAKSKETEIVEDFRGDEKVWIFISENGRVILF
jgi:uncharacterized protein YuzE